MAQTVEVLALGQMRTTEQVEILSAAPPARGHVCLDYTGSGVGMGDYLVKEFRECNPAKHKFGKIELCSSPTRSRWRFFPSCAWRLRRRKCASRQTRNVREDLHSVNRVTTPAGGITYRAPHTADGHADRCTALALALRAGRQEAATGCCSFIPDSRINRVLAERSNRNPFS